MSTQPNRKPLLCPRNQIVSPFCVHATKSRAPAVSKQPNCEPLLCPHNQIVRAAVCLWPANRPFVGCLLRLGAQPVPLLPARTIALLLAAACFPESPLGSNRHWAGAAAAPAADAEAAWCCRTGGCLSLFMTGSDPSGLNSGLISPTPHNLAG